MRKFTWTRRIILGLLTFALLAIPGAKAAEPSVTEETAELPAASPEQGFYEETVEVTIDVPEGATVYYTEDCSTPAPGSPSTMLYTGPIRLTAGEKDAYGEPKARVIRYMAVMKDGRHSAVATKTYFVGPEFTDRFALPIWSLVTDEGNLSGEKTGILKNFSKRGREWERPVHVTYFTDDGPAVSMNAGMRVHGAASRSFRVKSLRLYARSEYDEQNKFEYEFFEDGAICEAYDENGEPIDSFRRLLLRNGGNEGSSHDNTMMRDVLAHYLMKDTGVDHMAARPVIVYLNGELYGLFNLQERFDEHYIKEHYDIKEEQCVIFEYTFDGAGRIHIAAESATDDIVREQISWYQEVFRYCTETDLSSDEAFAKVEQYFDIDNFIDYYCIQFFVANEDWPGNNCKAWRYLGPVSDEPGRDGRLRWLLYDTEYAWGLYGRSTKRDTFEQMLTAGGTLHPYQNDATALFRAFVKNDSFVRRFVTRMVDRLNTDFSAEALTETVTRISGLYKDLEPLQRKRIMTGAYRTGLETLTTYAKYRAKNVFEQLEKHFSFGGYRMVTVKFDASVASLVYNGIRITEDSPNYVDGAFTAVCPKNYPAEFAVVIHSPKHTYAGVSGDLKTAASEWTIGPGAPDGMTLEVAFERIPDPTPTPVPTATPVPSPAADKKTGGVNKTGIAVLVVVITGLIIATIVVRRYR